MLNAAKKIIVLMPHKFEFKIIESCTENGRLQTFMTYEAGGGMCIKNVSKTNLKSVARFSLI